MCNDGCSLTMPIFAVTFVFFTTSNLSFPGASVCTRNLLLLTGLFHQGGDLMRAISQDTKNELRWSRKGGLLMLDIARGLTYLHANRVCRLLFCSAFALSGQSLLDCLVCCCWTRVAIYAA